MGKAYPELYGKAIRQISTRHGHDVGRLPDARGRLYDAEYERLCDAAGLRPYTETKS